MRAHLLVAAAPIVALLATHAAQAGGAAAIYDFPPAKNGNATNGAQPLAGVTLNAASQTFFGTTSRGGSYASNGYGGGVVYRLTPPAKTGAAWTQTVLHAFTGGKDGIFPGTGNLLLLQDGTLYGTTAGEVSFGSCGGASCDTVYKLTPPAGGRKTYTYTLLYRFSNTSAGYEPQGGLVAGPGGSLIGTTAAGGNTGCGSSYTNMYGTTGCGTIFQLKPPQSGATWTRTTIHTFSGGTDGGIPLAALVADSAGNYYGTASTGGISGCSFHSYDCGVVFKLAPPAAGKTAWTETVLYSFTGGADGLAPVSALILINGVLYGTAMNGGYACNIYGCGSVFSLSPPTSGSRWTFKALYDFQGTTDGGVPMAGVASDSTGDLYGTTFQYGDTSVDCGRFVGCGTVYKLAPPAAGKTAWTETTLTTFTGGTTGGQSTASLILDGKALFGTTGLGGDAKCGSGSDPTCGGTVIRVKP